MKKTKTLLAFTLTLASVCLVAVLMASSVCLGTVEVSSLENRFILDTGEYVTFSAAQSFSNIEVSGNQIVFDDYGFTPSNCNITISVLSNSQISYTINEKGAGECSVTLYLPTLGQPTSTTGDSSPEIVWDTNTALLAVTDTTLATHTFLWIAPTPDVAWPDSGGGGTAPITTPAYSPDVSSSSFSPAPIASASVSETAPNFPFLPVNPVDPIVQGIPNLINSSPDSVKFFVALTVVVAVGAIAVYLYYAGNSGKGGWKKKQVEVSF